MPCTRYKMEISAEKTKLMTNSANGIQREIKVKGQKLGTVTKLKPIWRDSNISLGSKVKLMRSLVISTFLYACESWTLTAELEKRTQAFEMRCYRRLLNILYKDHVTNEEVRRKIQAAIGEYDELLTLVKKRKLRWFGHVSRSSGLAKTILQGTVKGKRIKGRMPSVPRRVKCQYMVNMSITCMLKMASKGWQIPSPPPLKAPTLIKHSMGLYK